ATSVVKSAVNAAKKNLGIKSPSRVYMKRGQDTGRGLEIGLDRQMATIPREARQLAEAGIINPPDIPDINVTTSTAGTVSQNTVSPVYNINIYPQQTNFTAQQLMREMERINRLYGGRL